MTYILRARDHNGGEFFYTGRAGADWVSADRAEAFGGMSLEGARNRAVRFNQHETLHGLWFIVQPEDPVMTEVKRRS